MKPEDEYAEEIDAKIIEKTTSDPIKLGNLLKRRKVYGDIVQNATKGQLESVGTLLSVCLYYVSV